MKRLLGVLVLSILVSLALAPACGSSGGFDGDPDAGEIAPRPSGEEAFAQLLGQIRIEATVYGGLATEIRLESDTVSVVASWYGVDQPVLAVQQCQPGNVGGEQVCLGLADYDNCTFAEDQRQARCVRYSGAATGGELEQGKSFLPDGWRISPSTNANLTNTYGSASVFVPFPGAEDAVIYYQADSLPPNLSLCQTQTHTFSWSGASGLSELLALKYPSHALVFGVPNIPYQGVDKHDFFADLCVTEVIPASGRGAFEFTVSPAVIEGCPTDVDLGFTAAVVRETQPEQFAAGSVIRYGNAGSRVLLRMPVNCPPEP